MIKQGDLIRIPLVEGVWCLGQAVRVMGPVFLLATFDFGLTSDGSLDLGSCTLDSPVFLVETMDQAIRSGKWGVIGNRRPEKAIKIPEYLVQVGVGGDLYVQDIMGEILRPASTDEIHRLGSHKSYSPTLVESALRANRGMGEWLEVFNDMLAVRG